LANNDITEFQILQFEHYLHAFLSSILHVFAK